MSMIVHSVDIRGQIKPYGPLRFTQVQWGLRPGAEPSRIVFALLRYEIDGVEAPVGIRIDLDKKAIMDDPDVEVGIRADAHAIWNVVMRAVQAYRYGPDGEPNSHVVQRDAMLDSTEHHPSSSNLEGILGRISAEVTADALERKNKGRTPKGKANAEQMRVVLEEFAKMAGDSTDPDAAYRRAYADIARYVRERAAAALK